MSRGQPITGKHFSDLSDSSQGYHWGIGSILCKCPNYSFPDLVDLHLELEHLFCLKSLAWTLNQFLWAWDSANVLLHSLVKIIGSVHISCLANKSAYYLPPFSCSWKTYLPTLKEKISCNWKWRQCWMDPNAHSHITRIWLSPNPARYKWLPTVFCYRAGWYRCQRFLYWQNARHWARTLYQYQLNVDLPMLWSYRMEEIYVEMYFVCPCP